MQKRATRLEGFSIRSRLGFILLCLFVPPLSGCHNGAVLHPIQGSTPKYHAVLDTHGAFDSGIFSVDLDHDKGWVRHEECKGQWESAAPPKPPSDGSASLADSMAAAWDAVYGEGYYQSQILKAKQCARGSGRSKRGTIVEAEICKLENEKNGKVKKKGVAKDNNNNIYRLDFVF